MTPGTKTMKTKMTTYRQGDVFIKRIADQTPKHPVKPDAVILAHGEVTGHCHAIADLDAVTHFAPIDAATDSALAAPMLLVLARAAEVTHQEHAPIALDPGSYRVTRQREYSPAAIRNVAD